MTRRKGTIAWFWAALSVAVLAGGVAVAAVGGHLLDMLSGQGAGTLLGTLGFAAVGAIIARRRGDRDLRDQVRKHRLERHL